MKLSIILALNALSLQSCNNTNITRELSSEQQSVGKSSETSTNTQDTFKAIKSSQEFRFIVNNSNAKEFGFLSVEGDQSIGIRDVVLYDDFAFIVDPFHGNIKKVNLKDGKISSSSDQLDQNNNLRTIALFNNALYVVTDKEDVLILDFDLHKVSEFSIPKYKWVKDIFSQTEDELILFRPIEDVIQQEDKRMKINFVSVNKDNKIKRDSIMWDYEKYSKSKFGPLSNQVKGKQYSTTNENGKHFLINKYGRFELKEPLLTTTKYYDAKNIDFSENRIVCFSITPKEVIIRVYNY